MSRCFPYPPPGYQRKSGALDEALINSIKLQKEKDNAKKEKKREKKEKRRKKTDRGRERENGSVEKKKQIHGKTRKNGWSKVEYEEDGHPRKKEAEQFEKSSLTEEHGQPVGSQNLYDSSDSTQNSHKRKKHDSPSDSNHNHGSILRIRLIQKDQEVVLSKELPHTNYGKNDHISQGRNEIPPRLSEVQPPSTSGRATPVIQERFENDPTSIEERICSTSGRTGVQPLDIAETVRRSSRKMKKLESQYRDLIENWAPPVIDNHLPDFDGQDWLFKTPSKSSDHEAKRFKPSNGGFCQGSSSLWPRACYLPEADIYALPYTLPF